MARIGLFPLELVLVPTERVPLNVFEPRYRELVGECLERGEEFGIVLVKESGDVHHVGTRDPADLERAFETFKRMQETVGVPGEPPDPASPQFDYEVTGRVEFSNASKQELLELTSPRQRLARLADLLERALEALVIDRELRKRAHGNGKVTPPGSG